MIQTNDVRIADLRPLIPPQLLKTDIPMTEASNRTVVEGRRAIARILSKKDQRLLGIIGPCSIHDPMSALEYAHKLAELSKKVTDRMFLIMRVYFEKPRTSIGWRGLIVDPGMDDSYDIEQGLRVARRLLVNINDLGTPAGSEMLDPIVPQYIADLISWAAIGARTTESQTHREMASGLSMPVGFKNGTSGNLQLAIDAIRSCRHPHSFIGIDQDGRTCVLKTTGNADGHIILRGGREGPNYYEENVESAEVLLTGAGIEPAVVIDCSHENSGKVASKQERVLRSITEQKRRGRASIAGFMLESNLIGGNQAIPADKKDLIYGRSVTDSCIGWEETETLILETYKNLEAIK